jgi:hypothetical protein
MPFDAPYGSPPLSSRLRHDAERSISAKIKNSGPDPELKIELAPSKPLQPRRACSLIAQADARSGVIVADKDNPDNEVWRSTLARFGVGLTYDPRDDHAEAVEGAPLREVAHSISIT